MERKKVVFINPHPPERRGEESISVIVQMPLNLAYLAALTPQEEWDRDLIDETLELALDEKGEPTFDADLVALTSLTYQSPRAYEIAAACRRKGMKVVMGGIHAAAVPEEAAQYVDSVYLGEAEVAWKEVLADCVRGEMKPVYDGGLPGLDVFGHIHPDREFCKIKYNYKYSSIVTTKGCPFRCEFCSVPVFQGRRFRERRVEDVWAEMEATDYKGLMLAEDNFYGYSKRANERARRLFKGMVDRGIWKDWFGFSTLATGQDLELLDSMAKSGCFGFLVGLESNSEDVLKKMSKDVNLRLGVENLARSIQNVHDNGMIVWGSVIFGADGDTKECFPRMVDYILDNSIDVLTYGISTPLPRTAMHKRLAESGRIFRNDYPRDWFHYGTDHVTYKLDKMRLEEFIEGMHYVYDSLYTREALRERFRKSMKATGNPRTSLFAYRVSQDWQRVFEQVLESLRALHDSGDYPAERTIAGGMPVAAQMQ